MANPNGDKRNSLLKNQDISPEPTCVKECCGSESPCLGNLNNQTIYRVKIIHSSATEICICSQGLDIKGGDQVIVHTRYGKELSRVQGIIHDFEHDNDEVQIIERKATRQDIERFCAYEQKEISAFETCKEKIIEHGLEMKLLSAHYLIDEAKILFYFTAEVRVDFRELVKNLVAIFNMRIELRQIGVRDEARVLGGIGVCGRDYCCHGITDKLKPVSIKMAKEQNLTLNSMKISGPCGRLLCCLAYEYDTYREIKKELPQEGTRINFDGEILKVLEINMFSKKIKLEGDSGRHLDLDLERFIYSKGKEGWQILDA